MKKKLLILLLIFGMIMISQPVLADECTYSDEKTCVDNGCYWNTTRNSDGSITSACSNKLQYVSCGSATGIPAFVPRLTSFAVTLIKYVVPIVLIIMSMIALTKAVMSGSADEANKVKGKIINKFIAAALVFLVISITQFIVLKAANNTEHTDIRACFNCLLNNNCTYTNSDS